MTEFIPRNGAAPASAAVLPTLATLIYSAARRPRPALATLILRAARWHAWQAYLRAERAARR